jgi:hypothetical protein
MERLSERDWRVMQTVNLLRVVSGNQLERLHFHALFGHTRSVVRGRVLQRLVAWKALTILPRRIGGAARGSAGATFALGSAGARLYTERQAASGAPSRVRVPGAPTDRSLRHTLAVSELYVCLVEQARVHGAQVGAFEAEPASWWPNGLGGVLKPDAYALLLLGPVREHWWIEVDLATESLPTLRRKLLTYLDFVARGQLGPGNVVPRVVLSCVTQERAVALRATISRLATPAPLLFLALPQEESARCLIRSLSE